MTGVLKDICAVKGVCAWPNLQRLDNGELLAFMFNKPSHAREEGELDCYSSLDNGESWQRKSSIFPHEPETTRLNCAVGAFGQKVIALCAGWKLGEPVNGYRELLELLPPWSSFSDNAGADWKLNKKTQGLYHIPYVPFGNIVKDADGNYCVTPYVSLNGWVPYPRRTASHPQSVLLSLFARSMDEGKSWHIISQICQGGNETCPLHLGNGKWIASVRSERLGLLQYNSDDNGATWHYAQQLTFPNQVTSNLILLRDGRILLSYGNRNLNSCGVEVKTSDDGGKRWSAPIRIANTTTEDCGYPSTVELPDCSLVTAYYTATEEIHKYEMRVVTWKL